jgi:hypothetical protein
VDELLVTVAELSHALHLDLADDDPDATQVVAASSNTVLDRLTTDVPTAEHLTHPWDREAALAVAIQVWQARQAPGGQIVGADLGTYISPHLLGPGLVARVDGLILACSPGRRPKVG